MSVSYKMLTLSSLREVPFIWKNGKSIPVPLVPPPMYLSDRQIVNHTSSDWGRSKVYLLGRSPPRFLGSLSEDYFLCSLQTSITEQCSSRYNASSSGQTLEALCGAEHHYQRAGSTGPEEIAVRNWRDFGYDFLYAMSLATQTGDSFSSYSRMLTQLHLLSPELNAMLPSPAEALLSMAVCTTLVLLDGVSFTSSPWVHQATLL